MMTDIGTYKKEIDDVIQLAGCSLEIDAAVFDMKTRLISCTDEYLRQKGSAVHAPSIEEVIANGNVVVNRPGHMSSCAGCRFIGKCPAKIEILKAIRSGSQDFGVMTLTSFTDEAHARMTKKIKTFVRALDIFSDWIAKLVVRNQEFFLMEETRAILENIMDSSEDGIMVADLDGSVLRCNAKAGKLFSFCGLHTGSAYHVLPAPVVDEALKPVPLKRVKVETDSIKAVVSANPVLVNDETRSIVFLIREDEPATRQKLPSSGRAAGSAGIARDLLGQCPEIMELKEKIGKFSQSRSNILITGETGTGKGLAARLIHEKSPWRDKPFIPVNCASIPETLFESELFGYEEGAFTGAKKGGKKGRFDLARGGTIFLDEIGEMPLHMQVKLLSVLQDHSFQRVGGVDLISADARVIAATNQDPQTMMMEKKFRPDLFYRLNVIPLSLPPLRERQGDLDILAYFFLRNACIRSGRSIEKISESVMAAFRAHDWPGNIRELQNVIEYSVNIEETDVITQASLPEYFSGQRLSAEVSGKNIRAGALAAELDMILSCLDRHGHDVKGKIRAAQELGISLRTLYRKLEKSAG